MQMQKTSLDQAAEGVGAIDFDVAGHELPAQSAGAR